MGMFKRLLGWIREARGSAIWDATKWLWGAGGSVLTAATQAIYAWWKGHPDAVALLIGIGEIFLFVIVAVIVAVIQTKRRATETTPHIPGTLAPQPTGGGVASFDTKLGSNTKLDMVVGRHSGAPEFRYTTEGKFTREIDLGFRPTKVHIVSPAAQDVGVDQLPVEIPVAGGRITVNHFSEQGIVINEWGVAGIQITGYVLESVPSVSPVEATDQSQLLKTAPQILVRYSKLGMMETLTFENDVDNAALKPELGPLCWSQKQPIGLDHAIAAVRKGRPEECRIQPVDRGDHHLTTLFDFMRQYTPADAVTSVTVLYEDREQTRFSREFILTSYPAGRGTITWAPESVKLR